MLPATLDQFNRGRVTHYTGYKPHAGPGATTMQPAHGPASETTQGFVNLQVKKAGHQAAKDADDCSQVAEHHWLGQLQTWDIQGPGLLLAWRQALIAGSVI